MTYNPSAPGQRRTSELYAAGRVERVASDRQLHQAYGRLRRRILRSGGGGVLEITDGFTWKTPLVIDVAGVSLRGVGTPDVPVNFPALMPYVIRVTAWLCSIIDINFLSGGGVAPTSLVEVSGANYLQVRGVVSVAQATNFILSASGDTSCLGVNIGPRNISPFNINLKATKSRIVGNSIENVTLQAASEKVAVHGNDMDDFNDSASAGFNTAMGNTNGGDFTRNKHANSHQSGNV